MLQLAIVCLVIALIAALLGFGGVAGSFVGVAKILFVVFLVLAVVSFWGTASERGPSGGGKAASIRAERVGLRRVSGHDSQYTPGGWAMGSAN